MHESFWVCINQFLAPLPILLILGETCHGLRFKDF